VAARAASCTQVAVNNIVYTCSTRRLQYAERSGHTLKAYESCALFGPRTCPPSLGNFTWTEQPSSSTLQGYWGCAMFSCLAYYMHMYVHDRHADLYMSTYFRPS